MVDKNNELFKPNPTHVFYPSMRFGHMSGSSSSGFFESYGVWSRQVDEFDMFEAGCCPPSAIEANLKAKWSRPQWSRHYVGDGNGRQTNVISYRLSDFPQRSHHYVGVPMFWQVGSTKR